MMNIRVLSIIHKRSFSTTSIRLKNSEVRVRFAPSPTGSIHLGGLRAAFYNYVFAKQNNGKFILRIEDTDQSRLVSGSAEEIERTLVWAGLKPDESPSIGGNYRPYFQSERLKLYRDRSEELIKIGKAYRCFCSSERLELVRKEQARNREKPRYDGKCRLLSSLEVKQKLSSFNSNHVVRFALQPGTTTFHDGIFGPISNNLIESNEGDPIIIKSDSFPTYHFANVVDDHEMRISHVLRGSEWISSTTKHIQLYQSFGWQQPKFIHFPLITMKDGTKMSKRNNQSHVKSYIDSGYSPRALINFLTSLGGGVSKKKQDALEVWDLDTIIKHFNFNLMSCHPGSVDMDKLAIYSRNDLKKSWQDNPNQVLRDFRFILTSRSINTDLTDQELLKIIGSLIKDRVTTLLDLLSGDNSYIWEEPKLSWSRECYNTFDLRGIVTEIINIVEVTPLDDKNALTEKLIRLAEVNSMKKSTLFILIRKLLTNKESGLPVYEIFICLGRARLINYLKNGLTYVR